MIRLYGHQKGEGSFVQVTRGMRAAAKSAGLLVGEVAVDQLDTERAAPGADAAIAVFCGAPLSVNLGHRMGIHKEHWLVLAPNSYGIPPMLKRQLLDTIVSVDRSTGVAQKERPLITGFLAPSAWAAEVLRAEFPSHRVVVSPHGVHPEVHLAAAEDQETRRKEYRAGIFTVAHLTSTLGQRKGTLELLQAWRDWGDKPPEAKLLIVAHPLAVNEYLWRVKQYDLHRVVVLANQETPMALMAAFLRHAHVVCQPSRAEGFGLVPLEARACGVPVVMTNCTGHTEHWSAHGTVTIMHGPMTSLDDYPGSVAPSVAADAVRAALVEAYETWPALAGEAAEAAASVRSAWSWEKKNGTALRALVDGVG